MSQKKAELKLVPYGARKHLPQKETERLSDLFFLLFTLHRGEELNIPITIGILMKTLFGTEIDLSRENIDFLDTKFYVYEKVPFNKQFYAYFEELSEAKLLTKDGYLLSLTLRATNLLQPLLEEFKKNEKYDLLKTATEENLEKCKNFSKSIDHSHSLKVLDEQTNQVRTIQDAVDNLSPEDLRCIEPLNKPKTKLMPSNKILNELLKIESGITDSDYEKINTFSDVDQFFKSAIRN